MKITYLHGDATEPVGPGPKIIAHCCNQAGIWGAGFVLALSKKWPEPEREYRAWAKSEPAGIGMGGVQFVPVAKDITVANIIGQWNTGYHLGKPPVRYESIWRGLDGLGIRAKEHGASVHMPRMGCGLAGGTWDKVEPLILDTCTRRKVPVFVYDWP